MTRATGGTLCVALDGSDRDWILKTGLALSGVAHWLKVGLEAFAAHGPDLVSELGGHGPGVFLDLKLHDIPATVERAAANCAAAGAGMLTVHAAGGRSMLSAAVAGARSGNPAHPPLVVAVTVLTSLDAAALDDLRFGASPRDLVPYWARLAMVCGVDGVVCSAREARAVRAACGAEAVLVTPGIRPTWAGRDDQRRVATPAEAVAAGADILVVGRPVTRADDPRVAARRVLAEMEGAATR
jgi:orotidine-5'-phosphate decarboxylase